MRSVILFLATSLLMLSTLTAAEIYRHVDAQGNVIFSDQPKDGAQPVEVKPTNIDASAKPSPRTTSQDSSVAERAEYTSLALIAPTNDSTVRQVSEVKLVAKLAPALKSGHKIQFLRNGEPLGEPSRNTVFTAQTLERGTYSFSVSVINDEGRTLITSEPSTVHIHRRSVLHSTR